MHNIFKPAPVSQEERSFALHCLLASSMLIAGVYLAEFSRLLIKPVFNRIFYGNMNIFYYHLACAVFIIIFTIIFHSGVKKKLGINLVSKTAEPLKIGRKVALYFMTALPVFITGSALGFRFKLVYELGERVDGMVFLGNGMGYVHVAMKLFCIVYFIALVEKAFSILFPRLSPVPVGGFLALCTFGFLEMIFAPSMFSLLYLFLIGYFGAVYLISGKNFRITLVLALIMYIL